MQVTDFPFEELLVAYFDCREHKRNSFGALEFEVDYEQNLLNLYEDLKSGKWLPGKFSCFIVKKPVIREIFAAPFRDRIVHHLLINRLSSCFEKYFIRDSFACRKEKGIFAAVSRLERFIRSESENGKKECFVLKVDIKGFFMSINRALLCEKLEKFIDCKILSDNDDKIILDKEFIKSLVRKIVLADPTKNCIRRSPLSFWDSLPSDKSLFTCKKGCGLPIGNLTSQVFANFYLY